MENTDQKTVAAKISPRAYVELKMLGFQEGRPLADVAGQAIEEFLARKAAAKAADAASE